MIEKNIKNLIRIRSLLLSYRNQSIDLQSNISIWVYYWHDMGYGKTPQSQYEVQMQILLLENNIKRVNVFKNKSCKACGRQPLKNLKWDPNIEKQ